MISTCFAFAVFAICMAAGGISGRAFEPLLLEATLIMLAAWIVVVPLSRLLQSTIQAHIRQYEMANPVPDEEAARVGIFDNDVNDADAEATHREVDAGAAASDNLKPDSQRTPVANGPAAGNATNNTQGGASRRSAA